MLRIISFIIERTSVNFDIHKLKKINDLGFIIVEKILVKFRNLHPLYFDFYDEMTENEIKLANISEDDVILHIGCGPIPATSIHITRKTGAQVTGIDHNLSSVKQAQLCISKYNLSDKVKIKYAKAGQFPIDNFNLIILSQGIKPHEKILEHIGSSMKHEVQVIFRTSYSTSGKLSKNDMFLKDIFKIINIVSHEKHGLLISILLNKK